MKLRLKHDVLLSDFDNGYLKNNTKFGHTVGLTNNTPSSISLLVVKTHLELHILTN